MRRLAPAALLLVVACHDAQAPADESPGARLEQAARAAGIVAAPSTTSLVGAWARDTDRVCIVPQGRDKLHVGVLIDYGEGQGCAASGIARRTGDHVEVHFGACRFDAGYDGERITFPADLPSSCDALCTGRASLSALAVDRIGASASEASQLRAPSGRLLCGG